MLCWFLLPGYCPPQKQNVQQCSLLFLHKIVEHVEFETILGQQPGEQKHALIMHFSLLQGSLSLSPFLQRKSLLVPFCKGRVFWFPFAKEFGIWLTFPFCKGCLVAIHLWVPTAYGCPSSRVPPCSFQPFLKGTPPFTFPHL